MIILPAPLNDLPIVTIAYEAPRIPTEPLAVLKKPIPSPSFTRESCVIL
jgi:hypothetical protein